jgi:Leucine-rich repeat (LRR) protein
MHNEEYCRDRVLKKEGSMKSLFFFAVLSIGLPAVASAQDTAAGAGKTVLYQNDSLTVANILNECGIKNLTVEEVAKFENGRVVSLDLSNRDIAQDGIKRVPTSIGLLSELKIFIAKNNSLTELPFEFFRLTKLIKLDLASNQMATVPLAISTFENLESLDLRHNGIEWLPPEIGKLKKLVALQLWGNKLIDLDPSVTLLPSLKEIYLKDNRMTTLPEGITRMKSLTYIDFQGNKLCKLSPTLEAWLVKKDKHFRENQVCW